MASKTYLKEISFFKVPCFSSKYFIERIFHDKHCLDIVITIRCIYKYSMDLQKKLKEIVDWV